MKKKIELKEGYELNRYGYPVRRKETLDPVPKASSVQFKRPLSAHERVLQAIRNHEQDKALDALPGDDTFDTDPIEDKTPHQLMTDPQTGEEMTAGEYVMLQHTRAEAEKDVQSAREQALMRKTRKKLPKKAEEEPEESEGETED